MKNILMTIMAEENQNQPSSSENCTSWRIDLDGNEYYRFSVEFVDIITVDWGDGIIEEFDNGGFNDMLQLEHHYTSQDENIVKVYGDHTQIMLGDDSCGDYVKQLISSSDTIINYYRMCYRCTNLQTIAPTFFLYNTDDTTTNCSQMFKESGLMIIQHNIFQKVMDGPGANCYCMFDSCFRLYSVTNLSIPDYSWPHMMFAFCENLYYIDGQKLVEQWVSGYDIDCSLMFANCINMVGSFNSVYWWDQSDGGPVFWCGDGSIGIFENCTSLENYQEIPPIWK